MSVTVTLTDDQAALVADHIDDPEAVCLAALTEAVERSVVRVAAEAENDARKQAIAAVRDAFPTPEPPNARTRPPRAR